MPHSSSIPRTPSQTAFDRVCDIYGGVSDVAKGDKRATAVLVDYFRSQPQDARVSKGHSLVARAHQLPEPAQRVGHAIIHSVSCGLSQTSQACAQARKLIDKLCILRDVKRFQEELERGLAYHGTSLQQAAKLVVQTARHEIARMREELGEDAPDYPEPHLNTDLAAVLRESAVLDEAVLEVVERVPLDKIDAYLAAYTDEISRLSDRLHALENDLTRVHVTVGPGAEVPPPTPEEQEAYKQLLAWAQVVHPGFHSCLERLDVIPDEVRAQVSVAQLTAFVALSKRAALSVVRKAFKPSELAKLQAFRDSPVWHDLEPLARRVEQHSKLAILHVSAPLVALLMNAAQCSGKDAAADGRQDIAFRDPSSQARGSEDNMEAQPFFGLATEDALDC